jgi:hypothetical protein
VRNKFLLIAVALVLLPCGVVHAEEVKSETKADVKSDAKVEAKTGDTKEDDDEKKSSFPVSGSANVGYRFNHANFVESEGDFGYQSMSLGASVSYKIWKGLSASTGMNVRKTLATSYLNPGTASRTTQTPWEVGDISLGLSYGNFYKIPVVDIGFSSSLGLSFPGSKASQAAGLIMAVSPGLSASWKLNGFSVGLSGGYSYFLNENPTVQIDCDAAPQNCEVSGGDTANPNALHNLRGGVRLGYSFLKMFSFGVKYSMANGYRAVEFQKDEFTSELAQVGTQTGLGRQSFGTSFSYKPLAKTSISVSMSTGGGLYTNDNKAFRFPFFDTESQLHHRTSYGVSISQGL